MSKSKSSNNDINVQKYYIVTRPTRLSELQFDDIDEDDNYQWKQKSRNLQVRRWRKVKNQLV
jgi:hypothetical protein